jgi:hypothetical protein
MDIRARKYAAEAVAREKTETAQRIVEDAKRVARAKIREEAERQDEAMAEESRQHVAAANKVQKSMEEAENQALQRMGQAATSINPAIKAPNAQAKVLQQGCLATKDPQEEIKEVMTKLRAMNEQHPEQLARIWEEERQLHLKKASAEQSPHNPRPSLKPAVSQTQQVQLSATHHSKYSASNPSPSLPPQRDRSTQPPASALNGRHSGWPPEKKEQKSKSAILWLNAFAGNKNNNFHISVETFGHLLDKNPTYIELCEQLEAMGSALDRGDFARALLRTLSHINHGQGQRKLGALEPVTHLPQQKHSISAPSRLQLNPT